jgi:hypothetical protein
LPTFLREREMSRVISASAAVTLRGKSFQWSAGRQAREACSFACLSSVTSRPDLLLV